MPEVPESLRLAKLDGIPDDTARRLLAVRVLVEAMARRDQVFSIEALADRTGLEKRVVGEILTSDEWRGLVARACADRVQGTLVRALARIDEQIISAPEVSNSMLLAGTDSLVKAYKVLRASEDASSSSDAEQKIESLLAALSSPSRTITQEFKHVEASAANEGRRRQHAAEQGPGGRDG